jgi:hypothetical protein
VAPLRQVRDVHSSCGARSSLACEPVALALGSLGNRASQEKRLSRLACAQCQTVGGRTGRITIGVHGHSYHNHITSLHPHHACPPSPSRRPFLHSQGFLLPADAWAGLHSLPWARVAVASCPQVGLARNPPCPSFKFLVTALPFSPSSQTTETIHSTIHPSLSNLLRARSFPLPPPSPTVPPSRRFVNPSS